MPKVQLGSILKHYKIYSINDLLNLYRDIEKLFLIVAEKSELKLENYNFEQDINRLKEVIKK